MRMPINPAKLMTYSLNDASSLLDIIDELWKEMRQKTQVKTAE